MLYKADSPEDYISQLPEDRVAPIEKLRETILDNLPEGFQEGIQYGMIAYYVPHTLYPDGYHCKPEEPLPFMSFASQKNSINLYHSGIYAIPELYDWFVSEYPKYSTLKLDMGKSCIRFKKVSAIPYELIGELARKLSVAEWVTVYEKALKKK
ncbi:DUF1801 domain-containing protein [Tamlana sp. 2_MG-2023]|uniref:DUF1801 domain-containing protein n=1 Tax=unclassified Tamlana TaxID=2614803 RepID=UPI0026E2BBAC|nr:MULTISPECIES: DUF1801 domain-containing protein [unclassified Tamlana]MDO6759978.1 DUF1801 domain-containing protein [Tamlana sp. 2_MG-2023]MDO6791852.1 DUF1801 domain-containing protein [Tamlana sp. 1_MG-2023]